jgi:hypothetical protein
MAAIGYHFCSLGGREDDMNGLLIDVERDQLDHQRARLEEILAANMVSPTMKSDLQRLLDDVSRRLWELSQPASDRQFYMQH